MTAFWLREISGWVLTSLGIFMFFIVYEFCERRWIFEAGIFGILGVFVFRGGIHLLKVAIAARICVKSQENTNIHFEASGSNLSRKRHKS